MTQNTTISRREFARLAVRGMSLSLMAGICGSFMTRRLFAGSNAEKTEQKWILVDLNRCQECGMTGPTPCAILSASAQERDNTDLLDEKVNKVRVFQSNRPYYLTIPHPQKIDFFKAKNDCSRCAIEIGNGQKIKKEAKSKLMINKGDFKYEMSHSRTPILYIAPVSFLSIGKQKASNRI